MPIYCYTYTTPKGTRTVERSYPIGRAPDTITVCEGVKAHRDIVVEHSGHKRTSTTWPMASDAAGVHPSQIKEAMEHAKAMGVPTRFTSDGRAIFTGPGHRKRYCEAHGLFDRNGGYSDPQRKNGS